MNKSPKRLLLARETVRGLTRSELENAGGALSLASIACSLPSKVCRTILWTNCEDCVCYPTDTTDNIGVIR